MRVRPLIFVLLVTIAKTGRYAILALIGAGIFGTG